MKLLLLGATGQTGEQLLAQALEQGHEITVVVRNRDKLSVQDDRVRILVGSVTDPTALDRALEGQDAVLSALGVNSPKALLGCDLITASMRALVPALNRHAVERVIFLSALGVGTSRAHAPLMFRTVFATAFRQIGKDKAAGEDYLHASHLDWTLVYPPALNNGPLTGSYRAGETLKLGGLAKISRADIAHFMLSQLTSSTYSRKMAIVGA